MALYQRGILPLFANLTPGMQVQNTRNGAGSMPSSGGSPVPQEQGVGGVDPEKLGGLLGMLRDAKNNYDARQNMSEAAQNNAVSSMQGFNPSAGTVSAPQPLGGIDLGGSQLGNIQLPQMPSGLPMEGVGAGAFDNVDELSKMLRGINFGGYGG